MLLFAASLLFIYLSLGLIIVVHKPLEAVVALAHFDLSESQIAKATDLLSKVTNWNKWLDHVEVHGLSGIATKHIKQYDLPVPKATLIALGALTIRHRSAANARYQALQEIDAAFKQNDVAYIALKGTALMPLIYHSPELRPMRDMDILVSVTMEQVAADALRGIGFDMPHTRSNKYMRGIHELPAATKKYSGFTVTVELHRDAVTRDGKGRLQFPIGEQYQQTIEWQDIKFQAFDDLTMINQVTRHMAALHPGAVLKLCNVMDVVGLAEHIRNKGKWRDLQAAYPYIETVLRCLHLHTPLPAELAEQVGGLPTIKISGTGQTMLSLRSSLLNKSQSRWKGIKQVLTPGDWWLHLHYNVDPNKSLFWVKTIHHPLRVLNWLAQRLKAGSIG